MLISKNQTNKIKSALKIILSIGILFNISLVYALTIKNTDHANKAFDIKMNVPLAGADYNKAGSCWGNDGVLLWNLAGGGFKDFLPGKMVTTGMRDTGPIRRVCLGAIAGSQKFYLNPVRDVPKCHIEFVKIEGKENGTLRATPECGYVGRCPDGDWYLKEGKTRPDCIPAAYRY